MIFVFKDRSKQFYIPEKHGMSQSLYSNYWDCQKKMRYILQGYTKSWFSEAIVFGSLFHKGLEVVYDRITKGLLKNVKDIHDYIEARGYGMFHDVYKEYDADSNIEIKEKIDNQTGRVLIMLPMYFLVYKGDFDLIWKGLEKTFKIDINDIPWRGMRDGEFIKNEGELWLFETKTKGRYTIDSIMKWVKNQLQINLYMYSLYIDYGIKPTGFIYNIIRNPLLKKKVRQTWDEYKKELELDMNVRPEFYFQRISLSYPFVNVNKYILALKKDIEKFKVWYRQNPELDMMNGNSCEGKYGTCMFIDTCVSGGRDFSMLEKVETLFPELN